MFLSDRIERGVVEGDRFSGDIDLARSIEPSYQQQYVSVRCVLLTNSTSFALPSTLE